MRVDLGLEGVGLYWCLIEILYEQGGYILPTQCRGIAMSLGTSCERIMQLLDGYNLFKKDGDNYYSEGVLKRLKKRTDLSKVFSESARKRWNKADPMPTHSLPNAIKGKKRKEKESIKEPELLHPLQKYISENCPEVSKLSKQLTYEEAEKITKSFDKELIKDKLANMENKKGFSKNYVSVYKTLENWCKTQFGSSYPQPSEKKQTLADLERYKNL